MQRSEYTLKIMTKAIRITSKDGNLTCKTETRRVSDPTGAGTSEDFDPRV
jgi:hypothetical protein